MKRIISIFATAFVLNLVWENLHSFLYANYMGGEISEFILLKATLADAVMITIIALPFVFFSSLKKFNWLIIIIGIVIAISIEWYALSAGRWAYNTYMPIVPLLLVGLTPMLQLGILGYLSFKIQEYIESHRLI